MMYKVGDKVVMRPGAVFPDYYYHILIPNEIYTITDNTPPYNSRDGLTLEGIFLTRTNIKEFGINEFSDNLIVPAKPAILKQLLMEEDNESN